MVVVAARLCYVLRDEEGAEEDEIARNHGLQDIYRVVCDVACSAVVGVVFVEVRSTRHEEEPAHLGDLERRNHRRSDDGNGFEHGLGITADRKKYEYINAWTPKLIAAYHMPGPKPYATEYHPTQHVIMWWYQCKNMIFLFMSTLNAVSTNSNILDITKYT
eukprot:CAMPEP_0167773022 /NCGR_PEP_ID=MMETSP0111_2-20121227/1182_1 /TAXON_ID=91324 /ORGANISM="Lotharella globosa, Strain CCCM811" /LENGTH=160 /DNA_ID=CAMNT_0007662599 /DNA_START=263 /DNA_END=742 /DNA_ORIENTATION=+